MRRTSTGPELSPYQSLSIERKDIRLLHVRPALQDGLISASLEVVSLVAFHGRYNAISWCWGDAKIRGSVLINDTKVNVPASAINVLQNLVLKSNRNDVPIWLDAICINQNDMVERAEQVGMMKDVYSMAHEVLAWGGPDEGLGCDVQHGINAIVQQCRENVSDSALGDRNSPVLRDPRSTYFKGYSYEPLPGGCDWSLICFFYSAELFSRLWIVQEISLARRPTCFFGDTAIPWIDVGLAAEWMIHRNYERPEYCGKYLQGITNCSIISHLRARLSRVDGMLTSSMHFKTSEPRDKIFGLLGLIQQEESMDEDTLIAVDYMLPVKDVYTMATKAVITATGRLTILRFPELNSRFAEVSGLVEGCPSWVPQFNAHSGLRTKGVRNLSTSSCDNHIEMKLDSSTPIHILRVQGLYVSSVSRVLGILTDDILNDFSRLSNFVHDILMAIKNTCPRDDLLDTLYRALTVRNNDTESLRLSFDTLIHDCLRIWPPSSATADLLEGSRFESPSSIYIEALRITNRYKSYFLADDGSIGLACSEAAEGDHICILFGNRLPFLLRSCSDGYTIVNNVFVEHLMDVGLLARLSDGVMC